jgi:hypothetical protein
MENEKENPTLERIENFLREMIEQMEPIHVDPLGRGRPRILPALCLWAGVLVCVLRGWNSQLKIWRLLNSKGLWNYPRFPISDQAVYKRLEQGGEAPLRSLFEQVSEVLEERLRPYMQPLASFASEVVAIDATTLDKVMRHLPLLRAVANENAQLLAGKLAGVFDVRLQQWRSVEYVENPNENEKVSAPSLLRHLQYGALILMDMGFFSFTWFDQLTQEGYYWITRLRKKSSYDVVHTYYQKEDIFDGLIGLGSYRADRARYVVRLITFRSGETTYQYITNVLNPRLLSMKEVAVLYARRWDIEMAFKLIKRELGLHLFWSAKPVVILQQIWAVLLISQILHALQLEIAGKAGVDPFDVSLSLLVEYLPEWNDVDFIALVVERGREAGFIRPSRRIRIQTPAVDLNDYRPPPPDLCLVRKPRYAHRRSDLD